MTVDEKKKFIIDVTYLSIILVIAYLIIKYFLGVLFPFVLGFVIAFALKPFIRWIVKKTKINNKIVSLVVLLLFYTLIGTGLFLLIIRLIAVLKNVFEQFPIIFQSEVLPLFNSLIDWMSNIIFRINPDVMTFFQQFEKTFIEQLSNLVKTVSTGALSMITNTVTSVPSFFLAFFFTIISSFFMTLDYEKITSFLSNQITDRNKLLFSGIQRNGLSVIVNFFKAYGILLSITFIEATIGLKILGYSNAMGIAFVIAIVDIFPVLGTGTILIPWTIIEFFNGNLGSAAGLLIMYAVITVIRQILEPRIVGDSIGLYPLVTLISMYLGTKYFGIGGLFAIPILVTILVKLQDDGIIKLFRRKEEVNVE